MAVGVATPKACGWPNPGWIQYRVTFTDSAEEYRGDKFGFFILPGEAISDKTKSSLGLCQESSIV